MEAKWLRFERFLVLVGMLVGFSPEASMGCTCRPDPTDTKEYFCAADFVILAKILDRSLTTDTLHYRHRIENQKVLWSEKSNPLAQAIQIVDTSKNSVACGVTLEIGKTYVFDGLTKPEKPNSLHVGACGLYTNWDTMSAARKTDYDVTYPAYCSSQLYAGDALRPACSPWLVFSLSLVTCLTLGRLQSRGF